MFIKMELFRFCINKLIFYVSVFAGQNKLSLAQYKVDEKSNEITAIEPLLEMLDIKGKTISIDVMGCQKEIAKYISKKEAHYILAVKDNQKNLHEQIQSAFKTTIIAIIVKIQYYELL